MVTGRRMLIVLDNAATSEQVLRLLPPSPRSVVLITSRAELDALDNAHVMADVHVMALDILGVDEALALLRNNAGADRVDPEPQSARELVRLCGCLPLAIHIVAGQLRLHPDWTISSLVSALQAGRWCLGDRGRDLERIRTIIGASYQWLPPEAQRLFRRLGALQSTDFDQDQAAILAEATAEETDQLLSVLATAQMIWRRTDDNYCRIHDLLLAYARELLNNDEPHYRPTSLTPGENEL